MLILGQVVLDFSFQNDCILNLKKRVPVIGALFECLVLVTLAILTFKPKDDNIHTYNLGNLPTFYTGWWLTMQCIIALATDKAIITFFVRRVLHNEIDSERSSHEVY